MRDGTAPMVPEQLVARARALASSGGRRLLGVTGSPGAGKSTLCAGLLDMLGGDVALIGMDGFHLANEELERLGRRQRKGAPDTFDVDGYLALLRRLRGQREEVIYAPRFDRGIEASIGSAVPVRRQTPLILTEGNYLLHDALGWEQVRGQLDEVWYLDIDPALRTERLLLRRQGFGHPADQARHWVREVDEVNAALVERGRDRADLILTLA